MLFHNNHDGTFTDVTDKAGVANERWGFGVVVGDYDNDGWPDIYVSNFGKNRLYHNNHDGTFTDVAEKAGVTLGGWSTGATWGDYDHDGFLDLFVPGYVKFDPDNPPIAGKGGLPPGFCQFRGINVMCGPRGLPGESDHLFHNNGDGTFTDVSVKAGVSDPRGYYGLSSVFVDVDDDGWVDLLVANDSVPKYLYRNKHDGTFEDVSYLSGFALNDEGREQAAMGIAVGDYNRDGRVDFCITNFSDDYNTLYRNDGDASFTDVSFGAGIANVTIPFLGWGTGFLDYDNDGLLDIFFANGHVYPGVDQQDWGTTWAQRPLLFRNLNGLEVRGGCPGYRQWTGGGGLGAGSGVRRSVQRWPHRCGAQRDGLDAGTVAERGQEFESLVDAEVDRRPERARGMRSGAKVFVTAGKVRQRGDVFSGGSYASSSDQRLHFGLGAATKIDKVEILWPDGAKEEIKVPAIDRILTVVEGKGIVEP